MTGSDQQTSIRVEDGFCVIRIPLHEVHGWRVAMAECPCKASKSAATASIRKRLATALGKVKA